MRNTPSSLILITTDCLRADHVGFMGYTGATTPFLDQLAAESIVVSNAFVAGTPTYYSLPGIFASRPPLALGRDVIGLAPGECTLTTTLRQAGFATAAFCAGNPYISRRFGYDQGFELFRDFLEPDQSGDREPHAASAKASLRTRVNAKLEKFSRSRTPLRAAYNEIYFQYCQRLATGSPESLDSLRCFPTAEVLVDQARAWLCSLGSQPFFLWLHFMDPHSPYYPSATNIAGREITPFSARYLNCSWNRNDLTPIRLRRYRDQIVRLYDAGIRGVDQQISRLVETLRRRRRWNDCVLAFTADHGEEFLDHGDRYHPPRKLTEEVIHVPLLLRVPGANAAGTSDSPFSLLHLAPTLLDAMHVGSPASFRGWSHWRHMKQQEVWSEPAIIETVNGCTNPLRRHSRLQGRILAIRDARFKLVLRFEPFSEEWFDLVEDPAERHGIMPEPSIRGRFLEAALRHMQDSLRCSPSAVRFSALMNGLRFDLMQPSPGERSPSAVPM
jgi:arylsulfatase A-like enzyme